MVAMPSPFVTWGFKSLLETNQHQTLIVAASGPSKMNGIEEAAELRIISQVTSETSRMAVPDLPLLPRSAHREGTRIDL
jgi:hypothetical protein